MRNFYEISGEYFLNIESYILEWEKSLDIIQANNEYNKLKLQSLGSLSQNLWSSFNIDRSEKSVLKDKHYMQTTAGQQAYCASFLLPNIERVFSLLVKDENCLAIKNLLIKENNELIIADFGCGPLSASIGLICTFEFLLKTYPELIPPKKIKILAIERSEKIFEYGLELIKKSVFDKNLIEVERLTSTEKITPNIDIALCANVFNEIPIKHRLINLNNLYNKLNFHGCILILEPGQEIHAKNLGKLRDDFISKAENCEIISPCSHKNLCPLSSSTSRTDWCWFRLGWTQPKALKEIEKFSKIDHHFLNFSYLFVSKSNVKSNEPFYARVVSDKLKINLEKKNVRDYFILNLELGEKEDFTYATEHSSLLKVLLCTEDGSLKSTLFNEMDEEDFKRGMRYVRKSSLKFLVNERN